MRDNVAAVVSLYAQGAGELARDEGADPPEVAVAIMRSARGCFMAPDEDEAFAGSLAALTVVLPSERDRVLAEAKALGDKAKLLGALLSGVPVNLDRATITPMPDDPIDLLTCWDRSGAPA